MPNEWKTLRVLVELPVLNGTVTEKELRWLVETALTSPRHFDDVARDRQTRGGVWGRLRIKQFSRVLASGVLAGVLAGCVGAGSPSAPPVHLGATAAHSPLQGFPTRSPVQDDGSFGYPQDATGVYDGTDLVMSPTAAYRPPTVVYRPYPVYDATVGNFPPPIDRDVRCTSTFNTWSKQTMTRCR